MTQEMESIVMDHMGEEFNISVETLGKLVDVPKGFDTLHELGGVQGLAKALKTDLKQGLPAIETDLEIARVKKFSNNVLPPPPHQPLWSIVLDAMSDHILILLMVASVVSIVLGAVPYTSHDPKTGWIDGVAILVAVIIVVTITSINDFKNQARFRELNEKTNDKQVKAIRGGEQCQVSIFDVRVGDIVTLDTGDIICADGVFVEGHALKADESSITGESDPIKKGHPEDKVDPFLISGSLVIEGMGNMLVTAVGVHSFNGKTMMSLRVASEDTPLQKKLATLASRIGYFGMAAAILLLLIAIPKYFIEKKVKDEDINSDAASDIVSLVVCAITIVVVAVPEGLPLAVTMALAYGMMKMFKENNLVRNLASCETMGSATTICSDKTGTLTQNVMTVVTGTVCGNFPEVNESLKSKIPQHVAQILTDGIAINSNAYEGVSSKGKLEFIGSKTEVALLNFSKVLGSDYNEVRKRLEIKEMYPFSSARKRMNVLVKHTPTESRLYTKGASEIVLGLCDRYFDQNGNVIPLDASAKKYFEDQIMAFASDALRTIGIAYSEVKEGTEVKDAPENGSIFIGIVGIKDPLRPEVPDAVATCQKAGITVRMVTGDNIITARNIAKNCGILTEGGLVMEGPEFRKLSQSEMDAILPKLQVLARSSPTDKQLLVGRLKDLGEVVAVTGDGTNDGPALKLANVGFSMGISGTEVAIAASDVVLLDDNFASIVRAVLWGRNIYDAICKFLQFQLTVNVVAVTIAFFGTITYQESRDVEGRGPGSPLTAVQLLWVNLIMDTLAALALATEPPTPELLNRPPNGKNAPLISRSMWKNIIGHSAFQLAVLFTILYQGHNIFNHFIPESIERKQIDSDISLASSSSTSIDGDGKIIPEGSVHHYTLLFNTFVFMQLFNEINSRVLGSGTNPFKNFFNNPIFIVVMIFTLGVQILFVTFGSSATSTDSLYILEWVACIVVGAFSLPWGLFLRKIPIKEPVYKNEPPTVSEAIYTPPSTNIEMEGAHQNETAPVKLSKDYPTSAESTPNEEASPLVSRTSSVGAGDSTTPIPHNNVNKPTQVGRGWQIVRQTHKKLVVINALKEFNKDGETNLVDVVRGPQRGSISLPAPSNYANLNI
ncbi:P-type ATPase [Dictyostelium purpureum]|uniref:Calcium-transporting ATPase n=1 Tax=Dictyostelium purpureum TaxID=5786 RepID=F0ZEG4_DICPU|nr:P-type ATPase [Dictyostelium purpureum]EGC37707.1 P-type ATPase [Dictyostelium purpureum]|eukprot:XP_003285811.1 P-type ATPase [Dictyostelium purpureum]